MIRVTNLLFKLIRNLFYGYAGYLLTIQLPADGNKNNYKIVCRIIPKNLFLPPLFLLSSAVVFQNDAGVLEKQGPDEQSDIGIGLR